MPADRGEMRARARRRDRHDLPEPDQPPRPGHAHRRPDRRGPPPPPRARRAARPERRRSSSLDQVGFPDPARRYGAYPHEFSGGMRQRAMIAMALSCNPEILDRRRADHRARRDDPGADPALLMDLRDRRGLSIILITHDLGDRRPDLRPDRGDARRPDRRGGRQARRSSPHRGTPTPWRSSRSHPSLPDAARPAAPRPPSRAARAAARDRRPRGPVPERRRLPRGGRRSVARAEGRRLRVLAGRDRRHRRRVGQRQEHAGPRHPRPDPDHLRPGPLRRAAPSRRDRAAALAALRREAAMVFQDPVQRAQPPHDDRPDARRGAARCRARPRRPTSPGGSASCSTSSASTAPSPTAGRAA